MGLVRTIIELAVLILLLNAIIFGIYYIYINNFSESEYLMIRGYDPALQQSLIDVGSEVKQFYPNLRFNHNSISYFINPECTEEKKERLERAFFIIEDETKIINFYPSTDEFNSDILVGCSEHSYETEKNTFIAGEGGPTKILNLTFYPVILKGKILLYQESSCEYPITELHELLHVFGFEHINDSEKIMYPYINCKQELSYDFTNTLIELYSIKPLAELYFENASAVKKGFYLNFSLYINNQGLTGADGILLETYANDELVDSSDLGEIDFGYGKTFAVSNLRLPSKNTDKITFWLKTIDEEYNKENNIIELAI